MSSPSTRSLVEGLSVAELVSIESSEELGSLLAEVTASNRTVVPFGGRGSLMTGNPTTADLGLDLTACSGVLSYTPADLTLSVRAGTTWSELQSALAEHGQTLPIDVSHPTRATVGGVVATGFAGARRYRQGTLRDLLIGCEYVRGDGLVARAGGMVVKNVSGFEIPRFLHGSWGALAVLTSVNLKVVPKPRSDGTVTHTFERIDAAIEAGIDLVRRGVPVDAIAATQGPEGTLLAVRATGRRRAVGEILTEVSPERSAATALYEEDDSAAWWQSTTDLFAESSDVLLVSAICRIDHLGGLASALVEAVPQASLLTMPGYGSVRVRVPLADMDDPAATLNGILALVEQHGGRWVVEAAPVEVRAITNVWGNPDTGLSTMHSIKRTFDPAAILNRGRLFV